MKTTRSKLALVLDVLIVFMVFYAWICMIFRLGDNGTIAAGGFRNLKYFTVLSNLLMAAASLTNIITTIKAKAYSTNTPAWAGSFKYMGATATALTFLVVITFLGPVYKIPGLYSGANLWFHVVVPILSFVNVIISHIGPLTMKDSFRTLIPLLVYGTGYIGNLLINGFGDGTYTNDWYGFLYWGWGIGIGILVILILISWCMALLMRLLHNKINGV